MFKQISAFDERGGNTKKKPLILRGHPFLNLMVLVDESGNR